MSISLDSIVVATKEQVSADVQGERVVLGLERGIYYGLEEVGVRIWELLGEPIRVSEIRDAIVSEYYVDSRTCEEDLLRFLAELETERLIDTADGPATPE